MFNITLCLSLVSALRLEKLIGKSFVMRKLCDAIELIIVTGFMFLLMPWTSNKQQVENLLKMC